MLDKDFQIDSWRKKQEKKRREKVPVTVCIAAIGLNKAVVCVADRMVTAFDTEYEPAKMKIQKVGRSSSIMSSGDSSISSQVIQNVKGVVDKEIEKDESIIHSVQKVAELCVEQFGKLRAKKAESIVLSPFGWTQDTFLTHQLEMSKEFIEVITSRMLSVSLDETYLMVSGVDATGPHIYIAYQHDKICLDDIGFGAIGSGRYHAETLFKFSDYSPFSSIADTLLLAYYAKKRSEKAPGVGSKATDMIVHGPGPGQASRIDGEVMDILDSISTQLMKGEKDRIDQALKANSEQLEAALRKSAESQKNP